MLEDLPPAALCRIEVQLDRRRRALGTRGPDRHAVDLRCEKGLPEEAPAQQAVWLDKQPGTLDPDDAVVREDDFDVDAGTEITADGRVIHDPILCSQRRHSSYARKSAPAEFVHGRFAAIVEPVHDRVVLRQ